MPRLLAPSNQRNFPMKEIRFGQTVIRVDASSIHRHRTIPHVFAGLPLTLHHPRLHQELEDVLALVAQSRQGVLARRSASEGLLDGSQRQPRDVSREERL